MYDHSGGVFGTFNVSICRNLNPTASEGMHCYPGPAGICLQPDLSQPNSFLVSVIFCDVCNHYFV